MPKTLPDKVSIGTMVKFANGKRWTIPATIDDLIILDKIAEVLKSIGYTTAQKI